MITAELIELPYGLTAGTVSSWPRRVRSTPTTGVDNNGDGSNNDRPVIDGASWASRVPRHAAPRICRSSSKSGISACTADRLVLRAEVFNLFNHANVLGRIGVYGNAATPNATFGTPDTGLANLDPARMVQFEARLLF